MASKASEWAKAERAAFVERERISKFECKTLPNSTTPAGVLHADAGRRNDQPIVCITDSAHLGGLYLDDYDACALARWILDTFSDETPAMRRCAATGDGRG